MGGFIDRWNQERPPVGGQFSSPHSTTVDPMGAVEWLIENSGVPESTIERILGRKTRGTELRTADALTAAVGATGLFYDGSPPTLPIYPNPQAPHASRAECCGGSLNGSGASV